MEERLVSKYIHCVCLCVSSDWSIHIHTPPLSHIYYVPNRVPGAIFVLSHYPHNKTIGCAYYHSMCVLNRSVVSDSLQPHGL